MTAIARAPSESSSLRLVKTAGEALSGHRCVTTNSVGEVIYCPISRGIEGPIWLTLGAASPGASVQVLVLGEVEEPSWSWTPATLVYMLDTGVLSSTPAPDTADVIVGTAMTSTRLFFDPRTPIRTVP